jgi:hypothetical protein
MKTLFKLICFMALTAISTCAFAQTETAGISNTGHITIPLHADLSNGFSVDVSAFNFATSQDALNYFNAAETKDVAFRPLLDQGVVMLYLQIKKHPDWTADQWNQYLQSTQPVEKEPIKTTTNN